LIYGKLRKMGPTYAVLPKDLESKAFDFNPENAS
jgi:hypothetical protein